MPLWTGAGRHGRGLHDHVGVAGLQRVLEYVRVAYFDGDADLSSPERTRSGVLDATGVAHFLGFADTPLARIGRLVPMLAEHQLTLLGYDRATLTATTKLRW
jgi:arginase